MKEFVEKLIERLEEKRMDYFLALANTGDEKLDFAYENIGDLIDSITVSIKILAEEYNSNLPEPYKPEPQKKIPTEHFTERFNRVM